MIRSRVEYSNNPEYNNSTAKTSDAVNYIVNLRVNVNKIESGNKKALQGAEFKLYKKVGNEKEYYRLNEAQPGIERDDLSWVSSESEGSSFTTNEKGNFGGNTIGLDAGTYYLEETKAPTGYIPITEPIKMEEGKWYTDAVNTLGSLGIVFGYKDGTFRPSDPITRAEFTVIAVRFEKVPLADGRPKYSDVAGHWAEKYIVTASEKGWINGYSDGTFRPDNKITRAEAIAVINRMLGRLPGKEKWNKGSRIWKDNADKTKWYYLDVQEASCNH